MSQIHSDFPQVLLGGLQTRQGNLGNLAFTEGLLVDFSAPRQRRCSDDDGLMLRLSRGGILDDWLRLLNHGDLLGIGCLDLGNWGSVGRTGTAEIK